MWILERIIHLAAYQWISFETATNKSIRCCVLLFSLFTLIVLDSITILYGKFCAFKKKEKRHAYKACSAQEKNPLLHRQFS